MIDSRSSSCSLSDRIGSVLLELVACFTSKQVALPCSTACMVCPCCKAWKGFPHKRSQAAWSGKARKALLLAQPSHFISYALSGFCNHQRPCVVRDQTILDRGNTVRACAPASGAATAGGSGTIPRMQGTASPAYDHAIPQPLHPETPTPQKRPGVPVYVMLPLDTVSISTFCRQDSHNRPAVKRR